MKPVAKKDIQINGTFYSKGDEIEVNNVEQLQKLNERGFIEPLSQKEIQDFFIKSEKKISRKEEENKWD